MRIAGDYGTGVPKMDPETAREARRASFTPVIASEEKRDAAAAARHTSPAATKAATKTTTAAKDLKTARSDYNGKVDSYGKSWASQHQHQFKTRAQAETAFNTDWKKSDQGKQAVGQLAQSDATYQAAVQDELRVTAEETDGDEAAVRSAVTDKAAEIKARDGGDDNADGLIDSAVDSAATRVTSETPEIRAAATDVSETGEALNDAAGRLKTAQENADAATPEFDGAAGREVPQTNTPELQSAQEDFAKADAAYNKAVMNEFNLALEQTGPAALDGGRKLYSPEQVQAAQNSMELSHPDLAGSVYFQHLIRDKGPAYAQLTANMNELPGGDNAPGWLKDAYNSGDKPTVALAVTLGVDQAQPANDAEKALAEEDPMSFIVLKYTNTPIEIPEASGDAPQPTRSDYVKLGQEAAKTAITNLPDTERGQFLRSMLTTIDDVRVDYVQTEVGNLLGSEFPEAGLDKILDEYLDEGDFRNPDWQPNTKMGEAMQLLSANMKSAVSVDGRERIWGSVSDQVTQYFTDQLAILNKSSEKMEYPAAVGEWLKQISQGTPAPAADVLVDLVTDLDPALIAKMGGGRIEDGVKILGDHASDEGVADLAKWVTSPPATTMQCRSICRASPSSIRMARAPRLAMRSSSSSRRTARINISSTTSRPATTAHITMPKTP